MDECITEPDPNTEIYVPPAYSSTETRALGLPKAELQQVWI